MPAHILELGPEALGFAGVRELEETITLPPMLGLLNAVIEAEHLNRNVDVVLVARLINAALAEIALLRRASNCSSPSLAMSACAIAGMIDGLLPAS